jgi:hypothetical protein
VIPGKGNSYRESDDKRADQDVADQLGPMKVMGKQFLLRASTFEGMRKTRDKFDTGRLVPWAKEHSMLRSGKVGRAAELLSPQLRQRIDDHCRAELQSLNCDFPYDRAFATTNRH